MKQIKILILTLIVTSCVQETHLKTVHFKVDMNGIKDVSKVGVRGQFTANKWNETVNFFDEDRDGIYEGTVSQKTAFSRAEFKFVIHDDQFELEGQNNRTIQFKYKPETIIYETCFNDPEAKITIEK